jgi:hypothetical protein
LEDIDPDALGQTDNEVVSEPKLKTFSVRAAAILK